MFKRFLGGFLLVCAAPLSQAAEGVRYIDRPEVQEFMREQAAQGGYDLEALRRIFAKAQYQDSIIQSMTRPAEAKPWHRYREIFLTEERIRGGQAFWTTHASLLADLERQYGVPASILVAIVGVETKYGANTGRYDVLDALCTLGFDYPPRANFFRGELGKFLKLAAAENLDAAELKGSYAGAMGMPQFIPSSYLAYAVDGDGDGRRDLWSSVPDVLASVANYFTRHGWRPDEPVAARAYPGSASVEAYLNKARDLKPKSTVGELRRQGVRIDAPFEADESSMLFTLEQPDGLDYWVGLNNFYVITRYNHSVLYAMAVWQLAQAIERERAGA
ncbi:MAG: lytic murein transglycosylase B [Halothiobacillaceae bacterium]|nr:lytic murein transglycosylase B [Halothiobacillaceae bacterium]MDY0049250.1 lytic murein transglycosylase B [Halothiobacillaceae bacterium]